MEKMKFVKTIVDFIYSTNGDEHESERMQILTKSTKCAHVEKHTINSISI